MCDGRATLFYRLCVRAQLQEMGSSPAIVQYAETFKVRFGPTDTFTYPHFHKDYSYRVDYAHFQFAKATTASRRITKVYQAFCMTSKVMKSAKPPARYPERSGPNFCLPSPRRAFGTVTV